MKKLKIFVLAVMLMLFLTISMYAEDGVYSGYMGADGDGTTVSWSLDTSTGNLTVEGNGATANYTSSNPTPLYQYKDLIKSIEIKDGITVIGERSFANLGVESITMADSVVEIKGYAFRGNTKLTSITLSPNITSIGKYAFIECKNLTSITIPAKVGTIGAYSFQSCSKLSSLTIEEGVEEIGKKAFLSCTSLTEVTFPKSLTGIGDSAFQNCSALTNVTFLSGDTMVYDSATTLPETTEIHCFADSTAESYARNYNRAYVTLKPETIKYGYCGGDGDGTAVTWELDTVTGVLVIDGSGAVANYGSYEEAPIYEYRSLIKSIVVNDGITIIGSRAFANTSCESITIADSVVEIKGYAFRGSTKLTSLTLSKNLTSIGEFAFIECKKLTSLTVPSKITFIGTGAFQNCSSLVDLTIEDGVKKIGNRAFLGCTSITEVILPNSVTYVGIETGAFKECTALEKILFLSPATVIPDNTAENGESIPSTATIYGFSASTAKNYADKYSVKFSAFIDFCDSGITVFELDGAPIKANKGEYSSVASLSCMNEKTFPSVSLLFANDNGELCVKTTDKAYIPLCTRAGEALILSDDSKLTVIYDDTTGRARYYFNQNTAVALDENQTLEFQIADQKFIDINAYAVNIELANSLMLSSSYSVSHIAPKFLGFQTHAVDDTKLRILAGVDMLYYKNAGFKISLYSDEVLQKTTMLDSTTVFSSVVANDKDLTAESLGFRYLSAITINDIDCKKLSQYSNIHLTIEPYATIGQEKIYGKERKIMISYDPNTNHHSYEADDGEIDLNGKKILIIGNSQVYHGLTVFYKNSKSVTSQEARSNDHGYFYQLCKENGFDVSVTNWTFGGHRLYDLVDEPCTVANCEGRIHINDLTDPIFDYVFISCGKGKVSEENFLAHIEFYSNYFKAANPAVKIVCLGNLLVRSGLTSGDELPGIYTNYKTLEDQGVIIADWGSIVYDVIHGNATVPNATQEFNINTFIIKDEAHPNTLVGYITALTAYCAITGESPIGQPYKFCFDATVHEEFDMEAYESNNYTASWASNFRSVFESEIDMAGIQQLVHDYLTAKPYRNY